MLHSQELNRRNNSGPICCPGHLAGSAGKIVVCHCVAQNYDISQSQSHAIEFNFYLRCYGGHPIAELENH